jgi:Protein of unknown function (DUF4232)
VRIARRHPAALAAGCVATIALVTAGAAPSTPAKVRSAAAVARCHTAELSGRFGFIEGAAGSRFGPVILRNDARHACKLIGYVGGKLIGHGGRRLHTVFVRDRSRRPRTVTLAPAHAAVASVHWSAVPRGTARCPQPVSLLVTPPDETSALRVRWTDGHVCDAGRIDVRPLVAR